MRENGHHNEEMPNETMEDVREVDQRVQKEKENEESKSQAVEENMRQVCTENDKEKKKDFNVNTMTIEDMEEIITVIKVEEKDNNRKQNEVNENAEKEKSVSTIEHTENDDESLTTENVKTKQALNDMKLKLYSLENIVEDYKSNNEKLRKEILDLQSKGGNTSPKKNDEKTELEAKIRELEAEIELQEKEIEDRDEAVRQLHYHNENLVDAVKESKDIISKLKEKQKESEDCNEMSTSKENADSSTAKEIEELQKKLWKVIKKIQRKDEELEEKETELDTAYDVIVDLRQRLIEHGEDLEEIEDDDD